MFNYKKNVYLETNDVSLALHTEYMTITNKSELWRKRIWSNIAANWMQGEVAMTFQEKILSYVTTVELGEERVQ